VVLLQKQPSPKATMAALYAMRAALSYTTAWDTIRHAAQLGTLLDSGERVAGDKASSFVNRVKPPVRSAASRFAIVVDFDALPFGGLQLEPMTL
ncbi:MAG TPA: hypothetical protein VFE36_01775, partial [Candidatus Baltobacteraceae bacterium]|nr:hypothetical protein [Candidatus Baltobacteraceae bacterium]